MKDVTRRTTTVEERTWWTVSHQRGLGQLLHRYREDEIASGLRLYGFVRRDVAPNARVELRWSREAQAPVDGRIWADDQLIAQHSGTSAPVVISKLRAVAAELERPIDW